MAEIRVVALVRDLITGSKIEGLVTASGASLATIESPDQLPPPSEVDVLLVDWGDRQPAWGATIGAWRDGRGAAARSPRVILFGPHTDLVAHADARKANLGPMRARSAFFGSLPDLVEGPQA